MEKIISASRRTDIPAFYGEWFMRRIRAGFAGVVHPFGGKRYVISLKPEDVLCFVFWTKNAAAFMDSLKQLEQTYRFCFSYTLGALPDIFEPNVDKISATESLKELSGRYGPECIDWRFDPIVFTEQLGPDFYLEQFEALANNLSGYVQRCIISFVTRYGKVERNFTRLEAATGVSVYEPPEPARVELAQQLAEIGDRYGISLASCCGDYLVGGKVGKAHCINGALIEKLFGPFEARMKSKPTRKECGCAESLDIGTYDTCPHGCIYCYANTHTSRAFQRHRQHDPDSAFLGYSKEQSDAWLEQLQQDSEQSGQQWLFDSKGV